ncbi:hypothetical protein DRW07_04750 [Alteromonas sediminis]|uniref:Uncharacterized protein n=1 Tax=Alteromonas sediminis TaxID=2259342 RepID=A0A3N5Y3Q5_9ALTE|nr:DUF4124 domain-containing protein [Alteromonas sediminis]RPJ68707.1 hypothetical protein DRW07_04750 [Alteromonas sediminis]
MAVIILVINAVLMDYWFNDRVFFLNVKRFIDEVATPIDSGQKKASTEDHVETKSPTVRETSARELNKLLPHDIGHFSGGVNCKSGSHQPGKTIYQWRDGNGVINLSNRKKPPMADVQVVGQVKTEDLSINIYGDTPPNGFRERVITRIHHAKRFFGEVTDKRLIQPVDIKIRLFNDKNRYSDFRERVSPSLGNTNGFYRSGVNESYVYLNNFDQGTKTAVHEAMHSINRAWFGSMSRWLNEGMAEVAETTLEPSESPWIQYVKGKHRIPLSRLFSSSDPEWASTENAQFYATSWAIVSFFKTHYETGLARLLLIESENGCNTVQPADIEKAFNKSIEQIEQEFLLWLVRQVA